MIVIYQIVAAAPGWKAMIYCPGGKSVKDSYLLEGIACWALVKSGERTCVQGMISVGPRMILPEEDVNNKFIAYLDPNDGPFRYMDEVKKLWAEEQKGKSK